MRRLLQGSSGLINFRHFYHIQRDGKYAGRGCLPALEVTAIPLPDGLPIPDDLSFSRSQAGASFFLAISQKINGKIL
jgi:hypothetical protein